MEGFLKKLSRIVAFVTVFCVLCTTNISATASLKTPKLQSFVTGAMEFENNTISVSNGVGLATEYDPNNKNSID